MKKALLAAASILACMPASAYAAYMSPVSDLISTSVPGASASHIVTFRNHNALPPSSSFTITPIGAFSIPAGLDYTDVDLLVSNGGPYADRNLAGSADAVLDGVSVVTGASGSITVTLNATTGIAAGSSIRLVIGTIASHQTAGDTSPVNALTSGSYRINIQTYVAGTPLDDGKAMVAIVEPIATQLEVAAQPPTRFNGLPSGTIAAGTNSVEITLETDEEATCRYATSSGVVYDSMLGSFRAIGGQFFYAVVSGHSNNTTYTYFVRCKDLTNLKNTDDYPITFTIAPDPPSNVSTGTEIGPGPITPAPQPSGIAGSGGAGSFRGGSAVLFQSTVTIAGYAPSGSTVSILKDGKPGTTVTARADGSFTANIANLERGTYTFAVQAVDAAQAKSNMHSATFTLGAGTNNTVGNIMLSPTIRAESASVDPGDTVRVFGTGVPGTNIELSLRDADAPADPATVRTYSASTTPVGAESPGAWAYEFKSLARGTYEIRVKTIGAVTSAPSIPLFVGVGEDPSKSSAATANKSDINQDGKVNLVDFSIMLTNWNQSDERADINADGVVNLADFSILLFNWTG